ncbi:glycosyltransferase [Myroides odoratus]|uniref:glycosyltransferase n=1 Tax=Myroides odoratus TaxID=256 RepID=UPI0033408033
MKVSHIIKSPSYDSDGRLQKWIRGFDTCAINSSVLIVEDTNVNEIIELGTTRIVKKDLWFRKFFKQRKGYFFKTLEYLFTVNKFLNKNPSEVIVFHDVQQYVNLFFITLFSKFKKSFIIWDLHELPHDFLFKSGVTRFFLKYILEHVDLVVYTNEERKDYIKKQLSFKEKQYQILNNYPDLDFLNAQKSSYPNELSHFKHTKPYILWLGGALKGRNFGAFFEAFRLVQSNFNLVILGKVEREYQEEIKKGIEQGIIYNAFVKQSDLIRFIDHASLSVVLYNDLKPNSLYCEPNRLYQLIFRKIPVVVGSNPTLKKVVEQYKVGVVLSDSGKSVDEMVCAFEKLKEEDKKQYQLEATTIETNFSWEKQFSNILNAIRK